MIEVAQPDLEDGAAPAADSFARRSGQPLGEQEGTYLSGERLMSGREAGHAVENGAVRFAQAAHEGTVDHRGVALEDRRRHHREPALAAVISAWQTLREARGLPPPRQP